MDRGPPSCPRCRYDQSGLAAAWADACPLTGVCSECGLEFEWSAVFNPPRDRWFVESPQRGRLLRRAWATWLWTLWPWYFWRRVGVRHAPAPRRMALWALLVLLSAHVADGILANASRFVEIVLVPEALNPPNPVLSGIPIVGSSFGARTHNPVAEWAAYASDDWTSPLFIVVYGVGSWVSYDSWYPETGDWPGPVRMALGASVFAPVMLLVLRATRRTLGLSAGHVARAAVYSLAWIVWVWLLSLADAVLNLAGGLSNIIAGDHVWRQGTGDFEYSVGEWRSVWGPPLILWWGAWWWAAIRAMRLPEAPAVWLSVVVPSLLFGGIVLKYLP